MLSGYLAMDPITGSNYQGRRTQMVTTLQVIEKPIAMLTVVSVM